MKTESKTPTRHRLPEFTLRVEPRRTRRIAPASPFKARYVEIRRELAAIEREIRELAERL